MPGLRSRKPRIYSDWDVYKFGLLVGARALPSAPRHALKRLVLPVEYIRCAEFRYVLAHLDVSAGHRVLDIGSPKLLSLFLAARLRAHVWATDLLDYFFPLCLSKSWYDDRDVVFRSRGLLMISAGEL